MMTLSILEYITSKVQKEKLHMTLIDPASQSPKMAGQIAKITYEVGTDAIMVGGSTGVTQENMDSTVQEIKRNAKLPVILFPCTSKAISRYADAIYFMSLLNSRNVKNVVREQANGAPVIKKLGIEPIPMGYIVIEPGMKVGDVGEADVIGKDNVSLAVNYALAAQYLGMKLLYLEAGSGAPSPVPFEMIAAVKRENIHPYNRRRRSEEQGGCSEGRRGRG